ncbi:MAG: acyl-CoA dehydrogenase [Rhizobiales bacterium NRL2]|jgi:alkylation response protein AidB-like acyl-CoA dehydrogenase|nr:MAG: acyl-CoA dehydrogenase [Rhizobiales bacterium NRL2]
MTRQIDLDALLGELGPAFAARSADHEAEDRFVAENYDALRDRRVFSALVPSEIGGGGASHEAMCGFLRALARHCPSTALALSMHQHLVAAAVANDRAGRPGRALLEKVAANEAILISTGANDWLDSNGEAVRVDGGYRVSAVKPFASGSPKGDVLVTSVAHPAGRDGPEVLHFPVPLHAEGVTSLDDWLVHGMRATGSQTIRLENVFVPDEAVAMRRPQGPFHPAFAVILTVALPLIMSVYTGIAEAASVIATKRIESQSCDAIAAIQVGELENLVTTADIAVRDGIRLANGLDFEPTAEIASQALARKTIAANAAIAGVEKAMEIAGGAGFFRKTGLERLLRDVRGARYHPLPEKKQVLFTGRHAIGLPPVASMTTGMPRAAA